MKALLMTIWKWFTSDMTTAQLFFFTNILPLMVFALATIAIGTKAMNWKGTTNGRKAWQVVGLVCLWLGLTFAWFWLVNWLSPEKVKEVEKNQERVIDLTWWIWRIGFTTAFGLIWASFFYRVKSGNYIKSIQLDNVNFSRAFTLISLIVLVPSGLCLIWLPTWWPLACVLFIVAWILGVTVEVPLKERWLPTWFGKPTEISYREPPRNLSILGNGLNFVLVPVYFWGFSLLRVSYAVSEIVDSTTEIPTKESPKGPDNQSITGPMVKVKYRLIYRRNAAPSVFINLSPEEQVGVETIITDIAKGWIASIARAKTYQGMIDWRAKINGKNPELDAAGDKVPDLDDLAQSIMQRTGAELTDFQVMDVDSPIEAAQNALAAAEAQRRQLRVEAESYADALGVRTQAEVSAMKLKFTAEAEALMQQSAQGGVPSISFERAFELVIQRHQADATRSVIDRGVGVTVPINPTQP